MPINKIRVLVVDDSAFMRKVISDILGSDSNIEVVATARNGEESLKKIDELQPDVVTMDIEMPVMDGLSTLKEIMKSPRPVPVIMLSSLTQQGAKETIQALEYGAFDFISKPSGAISLDMHKAQEELLEKVRMAARCREKISCSLRPPLRTTLQTSLQPKVAPMKENLKKQTSDIGKRPLPIKSTSRDILVGIGTSTGGPRALQFVLTQLPKELAAPIVIVQHMPPAFTKSLAERLNSLCEINVVEAEDGMELQKGVAYIAPGGHQMHVSYENNRYVLHTDKHAEQTSGHKPSVDYLFHSLSHLSLPKTMAVIMTGMGGDGAKGLAAMKQNGAYTVAEDESTCVVFGMPKVAIQTGAVDAVVPVDQIAEHIVKFVHE